MKFDFNKFTSELHEQFQDSLTIEDMTESLGLAESYSKDNPMSTGKNLVVNYIAFKGEKNSGELIDYNKKIEKGINIWIADNLKGKSSIFKIIKFALTGNNSLKPDIKKWIKEILLTFSIGNKDYTIYFNLTSTRLKTKFFNDKITNWDALAQYQKVPLFQTNSETDYSEKIQDFFFKQFSYYSLKWTQKSPVKDSND